MSLVAPLRRPDSETFTVSLFWKNKMTVWSNTNHQQRESEDVSTKSKMLILLLASAKLSQMEKSSWEVPKNREVSLLPQKLRGTPECWGDIAAVNIIKVQQAILVSVCRGTGRSSRGLFPDIADSTKACVEDALCSQDVNI